MTSERTKPRGGRQDEHSTVNCGSTPIIRVGIANMVLKLMQSLLYLLGHQKNRKTE